jgi:BMFP domain-containing protein YqiC
MHTENGLMDQMARLVTNAAGAAKGLRDEIATMAKTRAEKLVNDLDLVPREEFDAMRRIALAARAEVEALKARVEALETARKSLRPARGPGTPRPVRTTRPPGPKRRRR